MTARPHPLEAADVMRNNESHWSGLMFINGYKIYRFCFSVHLVCTNFSDFAEQGRQTYTRCYVI